MRKATLCFACILVWGCVASAQSVTITGVTESATVPGSITATCQVNLGGQQGGTLYLWCRNQATGLLYTGGRSNVVLNPPATVSNDKTFALPKGDYDVFVYLVVFASTDDIWAPPSSIAGVNKNGVGMAANTLAASNVQFQPGQPSVPAAPDTSVWTGGPAVVNPTPFVPPNFATATAALNKARMIMWPVAGGKAISGGGNIPGVAPPFPFQWTTYSGQGVPPGKYSVLSIVTASITPADANMKNGDAIFQEFAPPVGSVTR